MYGVINRRAKSVGLSILLFLCYHLSSAQTDIVTLSRVKDFINAGLTHIILSSDSSLNDSIGKKNWREIDTVLQKNNLEQPVYFAAMKRLLEGKFDSVLKKFSSKVDLIDVGVYTKLDEQKFMRFLYDTAFLLLRQQYPALLPPSVMDSVYLSLIEKGVQQKTDSVMPPADRAYMPVTKSPVTPYLPWYARFQGFLFWLLVCVLISVILFLYSLDQIRQLKIKLEDAEKSIIQVREEKDPLTANSGPVTTVYTEFRSLVTLKIKELYDIIDHLNLRIITLEKEQKPDDSLIEEAMVVDDSIDNEEIFYMSAPLPEYFPFSARSLKKDALYKFNHTRSKTEATFEVINEGISVAEALQNVSKFFEPACIAENEPQGEVRVIITKTPGLAFLDGQQWAIKQKAIILFI